MGKRTKFALALVLALALLALIAWVVHSSSGDESENSPCNLSTLTQPRNGSWGTTCQSASGEIPHGTSCDLSCNTGYTPSNQPTCTNSVLSSTTATCTLTSPTLSDHGGGDSRGSCVDFNCSSSDNSLNANPDGVTCAGDPCIATECCTVEPTVAPSCIRPTDTAITDVYNFTQAQETSLYRDSFEVTGITCNSGYGPGDNIVASVCDSANTAYTLTGCSDIDGCYNQVSRGTVNCGNNAVCEDNDPPDTSYTCRCMPGYTGPERHGGRNDSCSLIQGNIEHPRTCADTDADGSLNNFDCSSSDNSLDLNPAGVICSGDTCNITDCCTVENISEPPYYLGDNLENCNTICESYDKSCEIPGWEYNPNIYGDDSARSDATTDNILPASFLSQLNCTTYRNDASKGTPYIKIDPDSGDITCNYLNSYGRGQREGGREGVEELC